MTTPAGAATRRSPGAPEPYAGLVVAGGEARRLGGVDKPMLEIGGRTLLARSLDALSGADPVVVVGPRRAGVSGAGIRVRWTREDPPGGGPVAALAAGLALVDRSRVVVLAADLRGITATAVERLLGALDRDQGGDPEGSGAPQGGGTLDDTVPADPADPAAPGTTTPGEAGGHRTGAVDGAVLVDAGGHRQWLAGAWRTASLRAALPDRPAGLALRRVLGGLTIVDVPALGDEAADVDTPGDLP
ncbi:molybdenum cofactor guanylyltransferase [Prauserella alba]|uniref:Molybdenum cofactor guanylyltransferase n=1 Tax=Prauserella alba TaxID=176898 RepID=A0ABN1V726_9PSEU|nr:NTP transferase domain-containing protein [Prauserella alba]MCP2180161.1 MobA-like NTP transferase domain-containing protein [Prauserella alba]